MALLVTGATGHVGLTVVRLAVKAGMDVVAQHRSPVPQAIVDQLGGSVRWVHCALDDPFSLAAVTSAHDIDGCVHTAAVPNDRVAHAIPWETVQTNATATAALLELARLRSWRRFIYVSTGSVFQKDMRLDEPLIEDHSLSPSTLYGSTKAAGELFVGMYRKQYGLSAATVRISFVYGPPLVPAERDLPRGPVVAFLREAVLGIPIREAGGGDFAASFTHVDDVASGLLAAYNAPTLNYDIYHLGHGRNWTTYEVAEAVRAAVPGAVVEVGPGTMPWTTYNRMRGPLAGTRLKDDTGYKPSLPLTEGVAAFAAWMKDNVELLQR
ncbi:NAD-dependent epimerase/dehydratase family protein [Microvirga sp. G4-2]|uniref:NAD-dependent epimerase/dehydratase family protein n=1 Tax=Microvirga sp. G4-2 TaxID=3434467 RepID=UPI004043C4AF